MIKKLEKIKNISIYGIAHAIVDFCCASVLYSFVFDLKLFQIVELVILYNVLAFGLQSVFGFLQDRFHHPQKFAIAGCLFLILGICLVKMPFLTTIFIGIGNALFHVGGGVISLEMGNGKANYAGLFVAPGAIGLFFGSLWAYNSMQNIWLAFLPLFAIILIMTCQYNKQEQFVFENKASVPSYILIVILILLSICIRSIVGLSYEFSAKADFVLLLYFILSIALGKALGGFIADKFGFYNTAIIGLLLSIPLLKHGYIPQLAILGMFCFNLTMPITVTALANMMPCHKGFAFGLTTLALLVGAYPIIIGQKVTQSFYFFGLVIFSVIVSAISLKLYEKLFNRP